MLQLRSRGLIQNRSFARRVPNRPSHAANTEINCVRNRQWGDGWIRDSDSQETEPLFFSNEQLSRDSYSVDDEDQGEAEEEEEEENELTPASAMARSLTVRPKVFGPVPPEHKVSLVTKVKSPKAQQQQQQLPWSDFMFKARLAYNIFFPPKEEVFSPAKAVKSRLQMILVSDRSGLDLPTLNRIKEDSLRALAEDQGWEDMTEIELQVASIKPNGELQKTRVPLAEIPNQAQLRDENDYLYEDDEEQEEEEEESLVPAPSSSGLQWGFFRGLDGSMGRVRV